MSGHCDKCKEHTMDCNCDKYMCAVSNYSRDVDNDATLENYRVCLKSISRILNNVKYECEGGIYTLDHEAMGWVFYCRDLSDIVLKAFIKK